MNIFVDAGEHELPFQLVEMAARASRILASPIYADDRDWQRRVFIRLAHDAFQAGFPVGQVAEVFGEIAVAFDIDEDALIEARGPIDEEALRKPKANGNGHDPDPLDIDLSKYDPPKAEQSVTLFDPWARYVVPPFPLEVLSPTLRYFVTEQAELIGGDSGGLAMAVLATISGALDHRFALKMRRNGRWWVPPRLWVLLVGRPSTKKTPLMNCATEELDKLQSDTRIKYDNDLSDYVDAGGVPEKFRPRPPRLTVYDSTTEKLGVILASQDRAGVLVKRDELAGWIGSMEKYANSGRGSAVDRAFWLKAYDGGPYAVDRITRADLQIKNLSASIIGGIQPDRLAELHGLTSDGLLQRFLPVLLSASAFPQEVNDSNVVDAYASLIRQLVALEPQKLFLAQDAIQPMEQLLLYLFDLEQSAGGISGPFEGFVGKLAGYAGSLALILALAAEPDRLSKAPVPAHAVEDAVTLIKSFILPHAVEFYGSSAPAGEQLRSLASWILTNGKPRIVPSDLASNVASLKGLGLWDINQKVSPLVAGGWLTPEQPGPMAKAWNVNPAVCPHFAERAKIEDERKAVLAALMNSPRSTKESPP